MPIMETVAKKKPGAVARSPRVQSEIAEPCNRGDRSIRQGARDFESAVREWVKQASFRRPPT